MSSHHIHSNTSISALWTLHSEQVCIVYVPLTQPVHRWMRWNFLQAVCIILHTAYLLPISAAAIGTIWRGRVGVQGAGPPTPRLRLMDGEKCADLFVGGGGGGGGITGKGKHTPKLTYAISCRHRVSCQIVWVSQSCDSFLSAFFSRLALHFVPRGKIL